MWLLVVLNILTFGTYAQENSVDAIMDEAKAMLEKKTAGFTNKKHLATDYGVRFEMVDQDIKS